MSVPARVRSPVLAPFVAMFLLIAGCGDGDDNADASTTTLESTTTSESTTSSATTTSEATTTQSSTSTTESSTTTTESTSTSGASGTEVTIDELGVTFRYPAEWGQDTDYGEWAFFGDDGFVELTVMRAPGGLDEVASTEAGHVLQPYGTEPTIEVYTVDGREGRLIVPSSDSPAVVEGFRQSAVLVPSGDTDSFVAVFSDPAHIESIVSTLRWQS